MFNTGRTPTMWYADPSTPLLGDSGSASRQDDFPAQGDGGKGGKVPPGVGAPSVGERVMGAIGNLWGGVSDTVSVDVGGSWTWGGIKVAGSTNNGGSVAVTNAPGAADPDGPSPGAGAGLPSGVPSTVAGVPTVWLLVAVAVVVIAVKGFGGK